MRKAYIRVMMPTWSSCEKQADHHELEELRTSKYDSNVLVCSCLISRVEPTQDMGFVLSVWKHFLKGNNC